MPKKTTKRPAESTKKKTARTIVQTVFLLNSGIGIRTPTYRVRVCCATFTQYRYQLYLSEKFLFSRWRCILYQIHFCLSIPFLKFFQIFWEIFEAPQIPCRPLKMRNKYAIIKAILSVSRKGGADMRACYFILKFIRGFCTGFCAAAAILIIAAAAGLVLYNIYL